MNIEVNDKIELLEEMSGEFFCGDYQGIPVGTKGRVLKVHQWSEKNDEWVLSVNWDNGRTLNVLIPLDKVKKIL